MTPQTLEKEQWYKLYATRPAPRLFAILLAIYDISNKVEQWDGKLGPMQFKLGSTLECQGWYGLCTKHGFHTRKLFLWNNTISLHHIQSVGKAYLPKKKKNQSVGLSNISVQQRHLVRFDIHINEINWSLCDRNLSFWWGPNPLLEFWFSVPRQLH